MNSRHRAQDIRRVVLLPSSAARGDELVRRYRLARIRVEGPARLTAARPGPTARAG